MTERRKDGREGWNERTKEHAAWAELYGREENQSTRRKTNPSTTLPTKSSTLTGQVSNQDLRGIRNRPAAIHLNLETAFTSEKRWLTALHVKEE
jgi:hypothetical protein